MIDRPKKRRRIRRKGNVVVLVALTAPLLLGMGAFAIDVGYVALMRSQAQAGADAAALAAVERLPSDQWTLDYITQRYASLNMTSSECLRVTTEAGIWNDDGTFAPIELSHATAVRVTVERPNADLFFGKFLGKAYTDVTASATAIFADDIAGFEPETGGPSCSVMPFVILNTDWIDKIVNRNGVDQWSYDDQDFDVSLGGDGMPEINMYPSDIGTNPTGAGNFGTVDIGSLNNSTPDIERQIRYGPNEADLAPFGGTLELDPVTESLTLYGDTGLSASLKGALDDVVGLPRIIMLYDQVDDTGNTTYFRIVGFAGVTIVDLELVGNNKYVTVQPTQVTDPTAIRGDIGESYYVRHPVQLVR